MHATSLHVCFLVGTLRLACSLRLRDNPLCDDEDDNDCADIAPPPFSRGGNLVIDAKMSPPMLNNGPHDMSMCNSDLRAANRSWEQVLPSSNYAISKRTNYSFDYGLWNWNCNSSFSDVYQTGVTKFLPDTCPQFSVSEGIQCLLNKNISTLNFVGDSVTHQMILLMMCGLSQIAEGPVNEKVKGKSYSWETHRYKIPGLSKSFAFRTLVYPGGIGLAGKLAEALGGVIDDGHDTSGAWVVNSGLWHLALGKKVSRRQYARELQSLVSVLSRVDGMKIWRTTTAVRPSNLRAGLPQHVANKFKHMTNEGVRALSAVASKIIPSGYSTVDVYPLTERADDEQFRPGDIRHFRASAINAAVELLSLSFCS